MSDERLDDKKIGEMIHEAPKEMKDLLVKGQPVHIDQLFSGEKNASIRDTLVKRGYVTLPNQKNGTSDVSAAIDDEGYVWSLAARVPRRPGKSMDYLKDVQDFQTSQANDRALQVPTWYKIYKTEGIINNSINKSSALVSSEGSFYVRRARQKNRKINAVEDELQILLDFWKRNVNSKTEGGPVSSARGLPSIIAQGSRQAMIEGSWVGYMHDVDVYVPQLGKNYLLPMYIQSLSTEFIEIPDVFVGTGYEQFLWTPPSTVSTLITEGETDDERLNESLKNAFSPELAKELTDYGNVMLDPQRVIHVKHRGVDIEPFGESFIEPIVSDLAYKRALQALDFVTIESMVNRLMIVKVGSDDPKSEYHNLEFAQKRLMALKNLFSDVDPTMTILWAGPDIDVIDVGVHAKVAELDGRYETIHKRMMTSIGVPEALLTGNAAGQVWAGYEGYRETLRAMQNSFAQHLITVGERIANQNGFEGVEVTFEFDRTLLADQNANANLALKARRDGLYSLRRSVSALGGDYQTERRNRLIEMGIDPDTDNLPTDDEIFSPPFGLLGETRVNQDGSISEPGGESGRPTDDERQVIDEAGDNEENREVV